MYINAFRYSLCVQAYIVYTTLPNFYQAEKNGLRPAWRETGSKKSEHREGRKGEIREESWEKRETEASV